MTSDLVLEIAQLALALASAPAGQAGNSVQQDASVADTLLQIVQKGAQAYTQHTGEPLDPSLIQPENPV